jgi:uncharacterized protein YgfB (UPF0149 family)
MGSTITPSINRTNVLAEWVDSLVHGIGLVGDRGAAQVHGGSTVSVQLVVVIALLENIGGTHWLEITEASNSSHS